MGAPGLISGLVSEKARAAPALAMAAMAKETANACVIIELFPLYCCVVRTPRRRHNCLALTTHCKRNSSISSAVAREVAAPCAELTGLGGDRMRHAPAAARRAYVRECGGGDGGGRRTRGRTIRKRKFTTRSGVGCVHRTRLRRRAARQSLSSDDREGGARDARRRLGGRLPLLRHRAALRPRPVGDAAQRLPARQAARLLSDVDQDRPPAPALPARRNVASPARSSRRPRAARCSTIPATA